MFKSLIASILLVGALVPVSLASGGGDVWIIVDGKGRGNIIVTDSTGSTTVTGSKNQLFGASGTITMSDTECKDKKGNSTPHWHGMLCGKKDPNKGKGCGWGRAVKLSASYASIACLINELNTAVNIVLNGQWGAPAAPNKATAIQALCDAAELASSVKSTIDGGISNKKRAKKLKKGVDKLVSKANKAKKLLQNPLIGENVVKALVSASSGKIKSKVRKVVKGLINAGVFK